MPIVVIDSPGQPPCRIDAPAGGAFVDLCDSVGAPIPFACRSANCGTCRVVVLEGNALLHQAEDEELDVLDLFGDDPARVRLACCTKLLDGVGTVHVRPVTGNE